jgi:hypothetical protein
MTQSNSPLGWLRRLNPFAGASPAADQAKDASSAPLADTTGGMATSRHSRADARTEVVFLPRDPQWAYCFWSISAADRSRAEAAAARTLCLRVADVTGLASLSAPPHALQELVVDEQAGEWFLPVPLAGRDYRVELGYRLADGGWLSLAFSAVARIPELEPSVVVADAFVPFSLEGPATAPVASPASTGGVEHERFYRLATAAPERRRRVGSELLHELDIEAAGGLNESGAGLWASGRNESGTGLVRSRSFWLVADAELIVYGATEPTATLTIGDQVVPLDENGGFRIHVPFADGQQVYPIRAVAADGEQERSIRLDFERRTPSANVNTREQAVQEWF